MALASIPPAARAAGDGLPPGSRAWECIPGVVRSDGSEGFLLEVSTNGPVSAVVLNALSPRLLYPTSEPLVLHDDGASGDRVAGDDVFTAGPIKYDSNIPMAGYYLNDSSSPAGLETLSIGELSIVETSGATSRFLIGPSVGILRSDIPAIAVSRLSPEVLVSRHLANIQTSTRETQGTLRGLGGDLRRLTTVMYDVLPDVYDFWFFFSTDKMERLPRTSTENYEAGKHLTARVNFTGTGRPLSDDAASYGSGGALLGLNILDAYDRGAYSANATHEMLHQWASYLDTSLGLTEPDGHYVARSSVGSLLGGQAWRDLGDGTYRLDCNEGRNGAHRADLLDLYLMGLVDASQLPDWRVYSPSGPPPLLRCSDVIADVTATVTMAQIQQRHGVRGPGQRQFSLAFAIESHDRALTATEMTYYDILAAGYVSAVPVGTPDPYVGFNWAPVTRFFGPAVAWTAVLQPGDLNRDGRSDDADLQLFVTCSTGSGVAYTPTLPSGCSAQRDAQGFIPPDIDRDGDVDQDDFGLLQRAYMAP